MSKDFDMGMTLGQRRDADTTTEAMTRLRTGLPEAGASADLRLCRSRLQADLAAADAPGRGTAVLYVPLAALLLLGSCGAPEDPAATLQAYLRHLARGEMEPAFELLAARSQARLAEGEHAWRAGIPHELAPSDPPPAGSSRPGLALFARWARGPCPAGAACVPAEAAQAVGSPRIEAQAARVPVRTPLGDREVTLVREGEAWRIVLELEVHQDERPAAENGRPPRR